MFSGAKWSHAIDITSMGQVSHYFLQCIATNMDTLVANLTALRLTDAAQFLLRHGN